MQYAKISEKRKGVLIGKNGEIKKEIEKRTKTKIHIGDQIIIEGDTYGEILAEQIISAIDLGFSAEKALLLLKDGYSYKFIPMSGKRSKAIKGRIIGRAGITRNIIEKLSHTYICVGEEGIGIIGLDDDVEDVSECIMMLASGASHGAAYRFLEKRMSNKRTF